MADNNYHGQSGLEKANEGLYRPDVTPRLKSRAKLHRDHRPVQKSWKEEKTEQKTAYQKKPIPSSFFSKLFIVSLIFFVAAVVVAAVTIATSSNVSNKRINVQVLGRTFVDGGETLPLQVVVANNNTTELQLADIVIEYPTATDTQRIRRSVGTVDARQQVIEEFDLTLFGEEGTVVPMEVTLEYRIPGSNAILTKATDYEVTLRSTPVVLTVSGPQSSLPNQQITIDYVVVSNSSTLVEDTVLVTEYPPDFEYESANMNPSFSNNIWILGDLEPGMQRTISVTGTVRGIQGSTLAFKGTLGRQDPRDEKQVGTVFATMAHSLRLDPPFITTELMVNNVTDNEIIVSPNDDIRVTVNYQNPLTMRITNAAIRVSLQGVFDASKVNAGSGFYDSATNSILWDANNQQELAVLEPGERGSLSFALKTALTSAQTQTVSDPTIRLSTAINGVVEGGQVQSAQAVDVATIKIASDMRVLAETQYTSGALVNSGPMPPQVGQQTSYTIALSMTNSSNTITDGVVRFSLPSYVTWLNIVSPQQSPVTYNATTREVVWTVGSIESGVGYSKPAKELAFKVGITPSASQIGDSPALTSSITATGVDAFTGAQLQSNRPALTTRLLNESIVGSDGRVVQ